MRRPPEHSQVSLPERSPHRVQITLDSVRWFYELLECKLFRLELGA